MNGEKTINTEIMLIVNNEVAVVKQGIDVNSVKAIYYVSTLEYGFKHVREDDLQELLKYWLDNKKDFPKIMGYEIPLEDWK